MVTVKIPGLNKVRAKGRIYYYHRATGTRIQAEFGTAEFVAEVEALNKPRKDIGASRTIPGSLGALIAAYRDPDNPEFAGLAASTKADYLEVLDYFAPLAGMPMRQIDQAFVIDLRDRAFKKRKRRFANYVVQVLRLVINWGLPRKDKAGRPYAAAPNPAAEVPLIARPTQMAPANRPWKPFEVQAALREAKGGMRVAIALGYYKGYREADAIRFPWTGYDGASMDTLQRKNGDPIWAPVERDLRVILEEARAANLARARDTKRPKPASLVMVTGERGRPFRTDSGFRTMFFRLIAELEAAGKVGPGLTFHGLRHTVGTEVADLGGSVDDVKAALGHRSDAAAKIYVQGADSRRRAARVVKIRERARNKKLQNRGD